MAGVMMRAELSRRRVSRLLRQADRLGKKARRSRQRRPSAWELVTASRHGRYEPNMMAEPWDSEQALLDYLRSHGLLDRTAPSTGGGGKDESKWPAQPFANPSPDHPDDSADGSGGEDGEIVAAQLLSWLRAFHRTQLQPSDGGLARTSSGQRAGVRLPIQRSRLLPSCLEEVLRHSIDQLGPGLNVHFVGSQPGSDEAEIGDDQGAFSTLGGRQSFQTC